MKWLILAGAIALGFAGAAEAQEAKAVQCEKNADVRTVTMEITPAGCRVLYARGKAPSRDLWHYKAHPEKCQSAAQQFVSKLAEMGLTCTNQP